ncbi:hypothetical protein C8F01DRAFT_1352485 [Mycena amicta]|nr:hypothetical protein C8F01DRAFT_1352485 [Mycena amicta]
MTHPDDTDEDKKFLTTEMVDEIHTRLEARRVEQEQKKLKKGKKDTKWNPRNPSVISRVAKSSQQPLAVPDTNDASRPRSPNSADATPSKANKKCKKPDHDEEVLDVPNKKRKKEPDEEVLDGPRNVYDSHLSRYISLRRKIRRTVNLPKQHRYHSPPCKSPIRRSAQLLKSRICWRFFKALRRLKSRSCWRFLQSIAPTIDLSTRIETFRRNDIWGLDDLEPLYERDYNDLVETLDVIFRKPFMDHGQMHPRVSSDGMKKVEIHALAAGIKRLERQGV